MALKAICHPEKNHIAYGMCRDCTLDWYKHKTPSKRYGASMEEIEAMLDRNAGHCNYCELPYGVDSKIVADHNHRSGHFRALAHNGCNLIIAHAHESPDVLRTVARNLEEFNGKDTSRSGV